MSDPTPWLTDEESAAWVRLVAVTELLPTALDAQLGADAGLTHFEYLALMALGDAPARTMRMTALAALTNATLPRLSHVMRRLEDRGLVRRFPCPEDRRATNATLTEAGVDLIERAAPGHVETVRRNVLDVLTPEQQRQLYDIAGAVLGRLDPDARLDATSCRFSQGPARPAAAESAAPDLSSVE
ncbi:MarR family winged helix-turn-helix transcriptional regulator [Agromyces aerolatus]|uniref:MarR family winged helix-turn-helix transcriptional regulator n=1 Tax=Agromyces sp. LY-1074 TaxID=3074080 RepID=UPI0028592E7C|nr:MULTISPECIES: MarR family transcriptional regulator [unclassified Agromyces]MDR5699694.1 MarR family transcriptional regulator [Agromyces sp. LY-1074]MDR5705990.1 MarR family transcriptional regulator [Agromyces sp. LY-1358]